jgi:hypothetical protein
VVSCGHQGHLQLACQCPSDHEILNPDNDSLPSFGDDLGDDEGKYFGTVVGNDDCVYGILNKSRRIVKYNPSDPDTTSTVGEEAEEGVGDFFCGNGVLCGDGYIYAANESGQVLQIDATRNKYTWIGDPIYSRDQGWGDPIVGVDKCIYWPPSSANRVLRFDPRHNKSHRSWGVSWAKRKVPTNGMVEL